MTAPGALRPGTPEEAAAMLGEAAAAGRSIRPVGGGCLLDLGGGRPAPDVLLHTGALTRTVFHEPAELVIKVGAGVTLAALQAQLATGGQEVPWDLPWPDRQTVGGILAAGIAGPRRLGHGMPRDHVLGLTVALADGRTIRPGGRVVKNVAGYDLTRLFLGSRGDLGVITEVVLKSKPLPEDAIAVSVDYAAVPALGAALARLREARLGLSFLEVRGRWGAYTLVAGAEGLRESVGSQRERILAAVADGRHAAEHRGASVRPFLAEQARAPWEIPGLILRASVPRTKVPALLEAVEGPVVANAGTGVIRIAQGRAFAAAEARDLLGRVDAICAGYGGWAVQERGPLPLAQAEPGLGGDRLALEGGLRRVFDPQARLTPAT